MLGKLAEHYIPASFWGVVRLLPRIMPLVGAAARAAGLGQLPLLPADLPNTPAALRAAIAMQLRAQPHEVLHANLVLWRETLDEWLTEYEDNYPADLKAEAEHGSDAEPVTADH